MFLQDTEVQLETVFAGVSNRSQWEQISTTGFIIAAHATCIEISLIVEGKFQNRFFVNKGG